MCAHATRQADGRKNPERIAGALATPKFAQGFGVTQGFEVHKLLHRGDDNSNGLLLGYTNHHPTKRLASGDLKELEPQVRVAAAPAHARTRAVNIHHTTQH